MGKNETGIVITEARVAEMISAAVANLASKEQVILIVEDSVKGFLNEEQIKTLMETENGKTLEAVKKLLDGINDRLDEEFAALAAPVPGQLLATAVLGETEEKPPLNPDWLKGLEFRGARQEKVKDEKGGRPRMVSKPFTRPLGVDDVLTYSVNEDSVVLVTADGQKLTVEI